MGGLGLVDLGRVADRLRPGAGRGLRNHRLQGHDRPNVTLVVAIPWARIVLIAGVAMLAGWLASLAPAARAVKVAPSAALAAE